MTNEELFNLSTEELMDLNKRVINIISSKRKLESIESIKSFKVGDTVIINHPQFLPTEEFKVNRINKTNVVVKSVVKGISYNISANMLSLKN